jgi:hypothetical protein
MVLHGDTSHAYGGWRLRIPLLLIYLAIRKRAEANALGIFVQKGLKFKQPSSCSSGLSMDAYTCASVDRRAECGTEGRVTGNLPFGVEFEYGQCRYKLRLMHR